MCGYTFWAKYYLDLKLALAVLIDEVYKLNKFVEYHFQIDGGLELRGVSGYSCWLTTIKLFLRLSKHVHAL